MGELRRINVAAKEVEVGDIVLAVQNIDVTNILVNRVDRGGGVNGGYRYIGVQRFAQNRGHNIGVGSWQRVSVLRWVPC